MHETPDPVKALFLQALDLPEAERATFLAQSCVGNEALRLEVQGLLGALASASGFLGETLIEEGPGTQLGPYRLGARIGEGGFGVVYRAEQQHPLQRVVAIKIIKRGMDTQRVVQRFEQERQALARMQHPHIAAVYDGGSTPAGRPFVVMELVDGVPITEYCRTRRLDLGARLALFQQVCQAVQHAHHKGFVHRDLKPGNILCGDGPDGAPLPKVIDFGIAKAIDPDPDTPVTLTGHGQPLGTLEYMAPEQAAGGEADARADLYSLGVVLYELLCGRRPFERDEDPAGSVAALLHRLAHMQPRRPSAQLADENQLELPPAAHSQWQRRLRMDLDWVALRALAKDPAQRYTTPAELAADLQRCREGRPAEAGPPSTLHRLRCFIGRHRMPVISGAVLLLALVGGMISTAAALGEARHEAAQKQRSLLAMQDLLLAADPTRLKGQNYTVRQLLDDFATDLDRRFANEPEIARELHLTVGGAYRSLGRLNDAAHHLDRAIELVAPSASPAYLQRLWFERAWLLRELGRYDEVAAALAAARRHLQGPTNALAVRLDLLEAELQRLLGRPLAAEQLAERALQAMRTLPPPARSAADEAMALDLRGAAAAARGEAAAALALQQQALQQRLEAFGDAHPVVASSWANLAETWRLAGDLEAAEQAANTALKIEVAAIGEEHMSVARTLALLGNLARQRGALAAAEQHHRRAQAIRERVLPAQHFLLASGLADLGHLALDRGDPEAAAAALTEALQRREAAAAPKDAKHAAILQNLGVALAALGQHQEAERCYREALRLHRLHGGDSNPAVADCLQNLAREALARDDAKTALALHDEALELRQRFRPDNLPPQRESLQGKTMAAQQLGDHLLAGHCQTAYADLLARDPNAPAEQEAAARSRAARLLLDGGDWAAAARELEQVLNYCRAELPGRWPHGNALCLLAECRLLAGDAAAAVPLAEQGLAMLEPAGVAGELLERARQVLQRARAANTRPGADR